VEPVPNEKLMYGIQQKLLPPAPTIEKKRETSKKKSRSTKGRKKRVNQSSDEAKGE
jgi:hypothetical protein